jgi:hypothetical protein
MSDRQSAELGAAFLPEQVAVLETLVSQLRAEMVSRAELARIEGMLKDLMARTASKEAVTPEEIVVIAAAVTAFLGKPVRVRSARRVQPMGSSPWSQQGRVFIQASHNLGMLKRH